MKPEISVYGPRPLRFNIDALTVTQEEGMHDMFTAYMSRPGVVDTDDLKGHPCKVVWGAGFAAHTMYGYVDNTSNIDDDAGLGGFMVIGLGASSVMRSGQARSWRRTSPHRIATGIVAPYRLGIVTDSYLAGIDTFMQTSDSDWAALSRLADITGMSLVANNTTVRLVDVRKELGRSVFRPIPDLVAPDSFVRMETTSPVGYDSYEFSGIDALGASFAVRGGSPDGVRRHSGRNFASLEDARLAAQRHKDRERRYVRALAEFEGQLSIRCGDVCRVDGVRWYVSKCTHEVRFGNEKSRVAVELQRSSVERPGSANAPLHPETVVRNGRWVTARRHEVEL